MLLDSRKYSGEIKKDNYNGNIMIIINNNGVTFVALKLLVLIIIIYLYEFEMSDNCINLISTKSLLFHII